MARPTLRFEKRRARSTKEVGFFPADQWAMERMHTDYPDGKLVGLAITDPARNGMMGLFFGGLKVLFDNQEDYATEKKLRDEILKGIGFSTKLYKADGSFWKDAPDSMALEALADDEMSILQEKARAYVVGRWGFDCWSAWVEQMEARKQR